MSKQVLKTNIYTPRYQISNRIYCHDGLKKEPALPFKWDEPSKWVHNVTDAIFITSMKPGGLEHSTGRLKIDPTYSAIVFFAEESSTIFSKAVLLWAYIYKDFVMSLKIKKNAENSTKLTFYN